jgi:hypothetical protein
VGREAARSRGAMTASISAGPTGPDPAHRAIDMTATVIGAERMRRGEPYSSNLSG